MKKPICICSKSKCIFYHFNTVFTDHSKNQPDVHLCLYIVIKLNRKQMKINDLNDLLCVQFREMKNGRVALGVCSTQNCLNSSMFIKPSDINNAHCYSSSVGAQTEMPCCDHFLFNRAERSPRTREQSIYLFQIDILLL